MKRRLFEIIESDASDSAISTGFRVFMLALISFNVVAVMLETVENLGNRFGTFFNLFELISVVIFTIEYFARLWVCTCNDRYRGLVFGRVRFVFTPLALIDLLAILPFYIPFLLPWDLRMIRALRLFRMLRLLKLGRYSETVRTLGLVFKAKSAELMVTLFAVVLLLVLTSSAMYFVEHDSQPDVFSSIPATMWWAIATLTTVGYGDVYPITPLGKMLRGVIALLGIGLIALPAGILSSGFAEQIHKGRSVSL